MKTYPLFIITLVLSTIIISCSPIATHPPNMFEYPTAPGLTPASLDAIVGRAKPIIVVNNNWHSYRNNELGISVNYPPSWQAITLNNDSGVGLYPPESNPNVPTPMIKIELLDVPYSDQPLVKTESSINSIEISGVTGRQYQDSKFAIPTQSYYIELPYRNRVLFFITTEGPSVDLTSQLIEILKTFVFLDSGIGSENQSNSTSNNIFEVIVSSTQGWQDTQISVQAGTTLTIKTIAGQWTNWKGTNPYNSGDGDIYYICADHIAYNQCVEPLPDFPQGALVGKVNEQIFGIGSGNEIIVQQTGILYLRINDGDDGLYDNDGDLTVRIILSN
jgi:hypothetical protein